MANGTYMQLAAMEEWIRKVGIRNRNPQRSIAATYLVCVPALEFKGARD